MIYEPRRHFLPLHLTSKRWSCVVAHRRSGKTVAAINQIITRALATSKTEARYAYVAPFRIQAKDIAWEYLKRYTTDVRTSTPSETELSTLLVTGSRVRLYGADNPDALRGIYLDGVVLDEYADMHPRLWGEVIRPLLADRKGWAIFQGTPKGHNAFYDQYQDAFENPSWLTLRLRASETGIIPSEELADARLTMTDDQYEQEMETSFEAAIVGAYYGKDMNQLEKAGRITKVDYDQSIPVFTAWDLGHTDDTAIWWFQVVRGEIHVLESMSQHGEGVAYYAKEVLKRPYKYAIHMLPHDARAKTLAASGRSVQQQLQDHGLKCRIAPELSVQDGIQASRLTLRTTWFDREGCREGVEALKTYRREYDDERKVFREKPLHSWESHYADAFRILAVSWKIVKPEPEPEKVRYPIDMTIDEIIKRQRDKRRGGE